VAVVLVLLLLVDTTNGHQGDVGARVALSSVLLLLGTDTTANDVGAIV
jgi:hypothetical protein